MLNTPRALKSFLILAPHPKSLRQIGEPLVFRTNFGSVGIALLRSNGRKRRQPLQWKCASHPPSLFIQNHSPNREPLVFRNELRKRVRTFHGRFVYCGNGEGDRSIGGANLRKGHSPFNGRRTLRPNLSCGRFVYCGNWAGIEVLAKPIFVRGVSPFNGSGTAAPLQWKRHCRPRAFSRCVWRGNFS